MVYKFLGRHFLLVVILKKVQLCQDIVLLLEQAG